jgi:hypothetical protein
LADRLELPKSLGGLRRVTKALLLFLIAGFATRGRDPFEGSMMLDDDYKTSPRRK